MGTAAAWAQFQAGEEPREVRDEVLTSWRRSRSLGVDPEYVEVPYVETDLDSHFARVAVPIMQGMAELLVGDSTCLALSDAGGSVIWRWVSEPALRTTLDRLSVDQGFCFDEDLIGTNGLGTALETGAIAVVRGSEHFVQRFHGVTCVAAPVRHPVTRRTVGAVNVTCRAEHTNPLLAVVVRKLVDEVQAALLRAAGARERTLLDAFLAAQRRGGGPVLTLGDPRVCDVVIADSDAAELGLDPQEVWDGLRSVRAPVDGSVVELSATLSARLELVRDGVVLTVTGPVEPQRRRAVPEPSRWDRLAAEARALLAAGPLTVCGEPGTGKATLLATVLPTATTLDAATCVVDGVPAWTRRCADHLARPDVPLVVHHVDLLPAAAVRAVAAAVAAAASRPPLAFTATGPDGSEPGLLSDLLGGATLTVPPLRRRQDEIAELAAAELRRHGSQLRFAADAQHALRRYGWPGNHRELARVVRLAAGRAGTAAVGAAALPAQVRAAGGRRVLTPLEHAESGVIAAVLAECAGNKSAAAKRLGISRTALYAKLRSYRLQG